MATEQVFASERETEPGPLDSDSSEVYVSPLVDFVLLLAILLPLAVAATALFVP